MRRVVKLGLQAFLGLALVGLAVPAGAGPFDKIKKSASETTKKADDAADKTGKAADDVSNTAGGTNAGAKSEGGSPAQSGSAAKETGGTTSKTSGSGDKVSSVSTKFDFVPGDSVMFYRRLHAGRAGRVPGALEAR